MRLEALVINGTWLTGHQVTDGYGVWFLSCSRRIVFISLGRAATETWPKRILSSFQM